MAGRKADGAARKPETMRIQRALARAGVASRRHSEELIVGGRVSVNGSLATIGMSVDPLHDDIRVDGAAVRPSSGSPVWIVLHKPAGVMTTRKDPGGRQTVFDLLRPVPGLTYVGRLDYLTEGVLLLTTDGEAANRLTHPRYEVQRTYVATVRGNAEAAARRAQRGVELEDGMVRPVEVSGREIKGGRSEFEVTLTEGRQREVRRLCEALGLTVERLVRTRFGPIQLGKLKPGESRPLTKPELRQITATITAADR